MATTNNFIGQNDATEENLMEEDINDPDIEARLYAEIYYSNDTYPDAPHQDSQNENLDSRNQENLFQFPGNDLQNFPQHTKRNGTFSKRYRALLDGPIDNFKNSRIRNYQFDEGSRRNQRIPNRMENLKINQRKIQQKSRRKESPRKGGKKQCNLELDEDRDPDKTSLIALDEAMSSSDFRMLPEVTEIIENPPESSNSLEKESEEIERNQQSPLIHEETEKSHENSRNQEIINEIDENSKYEVSSKEKKQETLDLSSRIDIDSDDSIFEVPVPPKPAPPLISLQDSDDESSSSSSEEESPVIVEKKSQKNSENPSNSPTKSSSSSSSSPSVIFDESEESKDSNVEMPETENLVINCTSIQKGASSLEEIKRMRQSENNQIITPSDDESMTESEAMNWKSLEGEISGEKDINEKNESHEIERNLWQDLSDDSSGMKNLVDVTLSPGKSTNEISEIPQNEKSPGNSEKSPQNSEKSKNNENNEKSSGTKKRTRSQETENEKITSEISPKKKKRQKENNRKEMSFEEYIFEPMPKKLVAYYNEPRGGEMLRDIREIQNSMPRNPNLWAILDEDMHPPRRDSSRITCATCQRDGHVRSKCPEKPKHPICHICGFVGHMEPRCPYNKQCINCGKKYWTCRKTCESCNNLQCSQCHGQGHTLSTCPDNWRKYHQTTTGESVSIQGGVRSSLIMKPPNQLVCCNCCQRGHEVSTCEQSYSDNDINELFETIDVDDSDDEICVLSPKIHSKSSENSDIMILTIDSDNSMISENYEKNIQNEINNSNTDNDDVIEVPYEKPPIPIYCISDNEDDSTSIKSNEGNFVRNILSRNNRFNNDNLINFEELIDMSIENNYNQRIQIEPYDPENSNASDDEVDVVSMDYTKDDDDEIIDVGNYEKIPEIFNSSEIQNINNHDNSDDDDNFPLKFNNKNSVLSIVESIINKVEASNSEKIETIDIDDDIDDNGVNESDELIDVGTENDASQFIEKFSKNFENSEKIDLIDFSEESQTSGNCDNLKINDNLNENLKHKNLELNIGNSSTEIQLEIKRENEKSTEFEENLTENEKIITSNQATNLIDNVPIKNQKFEPPYD